MLQWNSLTIRSNAQAIEVMKSHGAEVLRRSVMRVQATRGSLEGKYGSLVVGTGDPATPEQMEANVMPFGDTFKVERMGLCGPKRWLPVR